MVRLLMLAIMMVTWVVSAMPAAAQADDDAVVPGERIGQLRLASRLADVESLYGRGTPQGRGLWEGSTFYDFLAGALSVIADNTTGNVLWIAVCACGTNPWRDHATADGVKFGTVEEQVVAAMGAPARTFSDASGKSLFYPGRGISFLIAAGGDLAGRVNSYRIYWPYRSPGDAVVVPGRRISAVMVGTPRQGLQAVLGGGFIVVRQGALDLMHWPHFALLIVFQDDRVAQVMALYEARHEDIGLRYTTVDGPGIGSTGAEVRGVFGEPAQRDPRGAIEAWVYPTRGVVFNLATGGPLAGRVVGVGVFTPR